MIRRSALVAPPSPPSRVAVALLPIALSVLWLATACGRAPRSDHAEPWFDTLASGAFLPRDPWLDFAELHRTRRAEESENDSWRVPVERWIEVTDGWGGPEEWGAWGLGEATRMRFFLRETGEYDFFVRAMAPPGPDQRPQEVEVSVNDAAVGSFTAGRAWADHRLRLPAGVLRRGWNDLELIYGYHLDGLRERDDRPLALGFETLGLLSPGHQPAAPGRGPGLRVYRDQEILVLEASGTYVVPFDVPGDAVALELDVRASNRAGALEVGVLTIEGREETLTSWSDAAPPEAADAPARVDLADHRGSQVLLTLRSHLPAGERFTIRRPSLVTGAETGARAGEAFAPARPPVVLIVLDAARADHFGVYGYPRDTTPHIDAFAAESLVFRNAVAECSYTLCSMPGLLTGLSYVQHGMVAKQLVLKDDVVTLAELLREAGYLTIGYTGNPNNSSVTGTHQGFDEYSEVWKTHPDHITRQLEKRLGKKGLRHRPFFLMLHYVPPHEPYAPDSAYDIFGDPAYGGPVTSDRQFTRAVYAQQITLDDDDLAEMVALYDGNLRMADAAVGRVFDLLRETGSYDEALIILTSDHGEAFLEHGRVGHNSTIYDEMVAVPLIVKLPASLGARAAQVDRERLVTLADVPATILALLGIAPPSEVRASDLLAGNGEVGDRVVFLRSAQASQPILGVRSARFKALAQAGKPPELYDLVADPGEEVNVVVDHPVLHTGLSLMLARALREPGALRAGVREGEIAEKDKAMLRALGYL